MKIWISNHINYVVYGCFTLILSLFMAGWAGHSAIQKNGCSNSFDAIVASGSTGISTFVMVSFVVGLIIPFCFVEIRDIITKTKYLNNPQKLKKMFSFIILFLKVLGVLLLIALSLFGLVWIAGKFLQLFFC